MPHRYCCSVLDEMRTAIKVYRIDLVPGMIEELQTLVNRMEAKLADYAEMGYNLKQARKLKKQVEDYSEQIENMEEALGIDEDDDIEEGDRKEVGWFDRQVRRLRP